MAIYTKFNGVSITLGDDDRSFANYPNTPEIRKKVDKLIAKRHKRVLLSDPKTYRVYYNRKSFPQLFRDIKAVMNNPE